MSLEIVAQSDARVRIDAPTASVTIRVARDLRLGRRVVLDVATTDASVRRARAARVRTLVGGTFRGDQDVVWTGAIHARRGIVLGKHTTLVGSAWSAGDLAVGRDAVLDWAQAAPNP